MKEKYQVIYVRSYIFCRDKLFSITIPCIHPKIQTYLRREMTYLYYAYPRLGISSMKNGFLLFTYIRGQKNEEKRVKKKHETEKFLNFLNFIYRNRRSTSGHPRAALLRVAGPRCSERAGRGVTHHQLESGGSGSTRLPTSRSLEPVGR